MKYSSKHTLSFLDLKYFLSKFFYWMNILIFNTKLHRSDSDLFLSAHSDSFVYSFLRRLCLCCGPGINSKLEGIFPIVHCHDRESCEQFLLTKDKELFLRKLSVWRRVLCVVRMSLIKSRRSISFLLVDCKIWQIVGNLKLCEVFILFM